MVPRASSFTLAVFLAGLCVLPRWAEAAENKPLLAVQADGSVLVTVTVPSTEAEVRNALRDAATAARLSPDVLEVTVTPRGRCEELRVHTRGFLQPFSFLSLRCPTPDGWRETLIRSDDFKRIESEWRLSTEATGTRIAYRIVSAVSAPIPQGAILESVKRSATATVKALVHRLEE